MPVESRDDLVRRLTESHFSGMEVMREFALSIVQSDAKRIAELEAECFRLASDTCHAGYGDEFGHHRCREIDAEAARAESAERALAEERERCARIADEFSAEWSQKRGGHEYSSITIEIVCEDIATAIRSGKPDGKE